jgi:hypothetical protein
MAIKWVVDQAQFVAADDRLRRKLRQHPGASLLAAALSLADAAAG